MPIEPWRIAIQLAVVLTLVILAVSRKLEFLRIIAGCTVAFIIYGMLQDQISARLSPEYFTIFHPRIEGVTEPFWLGIFWGFLGSWWGGMIFGVSLALTAQLGKKPKLNYDQLNSRIGFAILCVGLASLFTGLSVGFILTRVPVTLPEPWSLQIPPQRHLGFLIVACVHATTYLSSVVIAIITCLETARHRSL
jgi:hypothetical protein